MSTGLKKGEEDEHEYEVEYGAWRVVPPGGFFVVCIGFSLHALVASLTAHDETLKSLKCNINDFDPTFQYFNSQYVITTARKARLASSNRWSHATATVSACSAYCR